MQCPLVLHQWQASFWAWGQRVGEWSHWSLPQWSGCRHLHFCDQLNVAPFLVKARNGAVIWAYARSLSSINLELNWHASKKLLMSSQFWGRPASSIDWIFRGSADMPSAEKIHPNQDIEVLPKLHLLYLAVRFLSSMRWRQASRLASCSSAVDPQTRILSWMDTHPGTPFIAVLIFSWNRSEAGEAPKNSTLNLWSPSWLWNVEIWRESSSSGIWW